MSIPYMAGYRALLNGLSPYGIGTEGNGLYVAHTKKCAEFFGSEIYRIEYMKPERILEVDNEPLILAAASNGDRIFFDAETEWSEVNIIAYKKAGRILSDPLDRGKVKDICKFLTEEIKKRGYDCVRVCDSIINLLPGLPSGWDVLLYPEEMVLTNTMI